MVSEIIINKIVHKVLLAYLRLVFGQRLQLLALSDEALVHLLQLPKVREEQVQKRSTLFLFPSSSQKISYLVRSLTACWRCRLTSTSLRSLPSSYWSAHDACEWKFTMCANTRRLTTSTLLRKSTLVASPRAFCAPTSSWTVEKNQQRSFRRNHKSTAHSQHPPHSKNNAGKNSNLSLPRFSLTLCLLQVLALVDNLALDALG